MTSRHKYPTIRLSTKAYDRLSAPNGAIASTALERYFWLLDQSMPGFEEGELSLLRDACNGWATNFEPPETLAQGLILQVSDAIANDRLDTKWQVDGESLLIALQALTPLQTIAIVDAIEQYWSKPVE